MSREAGTAFYKGVKFWLTLLLAALLAALLWRTWSERGDGRGGSSPAAAGISASRTCDSA